MYKRNGVRYLAKKWGITAFVLFVIYTIAMYFYIFHGNGSYIPSSLKGTVADPQTFMTKRELILSGEYSKIKNFLFFVATPFEWLLYLFILLAGISRLFEKWSDFQMKRKFVQNAVYLFLLLLFTKLMFYPLDYYKYSLSKHYGISTQTFSSWMRDYVIDFWVNFIITVLVVSVLYWMINRSTKKWWFHAWILTIPFSIFIMLIQPVLIDPLYNDFYPLKNKELEKEILALADQANIPTDHVYEVNMAEKTNALNAYVTGIGSNSRIVLWDTTLNRLTEKEILFIMAHEMAHYVEKHIYFGIASYLVMLFVGFWLISKIVPWVITRYGAVLNIKSIKNIHSLPLILLLASFLMFFASPLSNYVSRYMEVRSDRYAMELTENPKAAISGFQKLTKAGLSEVNPPLLVKWFRYTHPPMLERINTVAEYEKSNNNK